MLLECPVPARPGPGGIAKFARMLYKFLYFSGVSPGAEEHLNMEKEFKTVSIPTSLYKQIEEAIKGTETASVAAYITNALREALEKRESKSEALTAEDEEKVKERLKALGYID